MKVFFLKSCFLFFWYKLYIISLFERKIILKIVWASSNHGVHSVIYCMFLEWVNVLLWMFPIFLFWEKIYCTFRKKWPMSKRFAKKINASKYYIMKTLQIETTLWGTPILCYSSLQSSQSVPPIPIKVNVIKMSTDNPKCCLLQRVNQKRFID